MLIIFLQDLLLKTKARHRQLAPKYGTWSPCAQSCLEPWGRIGLEPLIGLYSTAVKSYATTLVRAVRVKWWSSVTKSLRHACHASFAEGGLSVHGLCEEVQRLFSKLGFVTCLLATRRPHSVPLRHPIGRLAGVLVRSGNSVT